MTPSRNELRRRRADTRQRILAATRALLEQRPWSEISLEQIMREAGQTRTAFYRHFEDRQLLLLALLDDLEIGFDEVAAPWTDAADAAEQPRDALSRSLRALVEVYVEHGRLLHALADSAASDPDVRGAYNELAERLAQMSARAIEREVAAGRSQVRDPLEVARALTWMNERYLSLKLGSAPLADPETVAATIDEIWQRTIYGSTNG
jgi:AcrR family transcriptional regulator